MTDALKTSLSTYQGYKLQLQTGTQRLEMGPAGGSWSSMSTDTALGAVGTDTEGRVFPQLGAVGHTAQRGSWEVPKLNNEGTKPTGRGCGSGHLGSIPVIESNHPRSACCRESRLLVILWIRGQGGMEYRGGKIIQALKLGGKARPRCCDYPVQYFWWISILCVWAQMCSMSIICHLHTDPHTATKRTNVNTQTNPGSSGYVLRDTVIIKRPIRKCRRMFDCWNDSCFLFIILNKRRWFRKIVFPWLFFPGDGL